MPNNPRSYECMFEYMHALPSLLYPISSPFWNNRLIDWMHDQCIQCANFTMLKIKLQNGRSNSGKTHHSVRRHVLFTVTVQRVPGSGLPSLEQGTFVCNFILSVDTRHVVLTGYWQVGGAKVGHAGARVQVRTCPRKAKWITMPPPPRSPVSAWFAYNRQPM